MRRLAVLGIFGVVLGCLAALYFFGGFYNVAAVQDDPPLLKWALVKVRNASIARHAVEAPSVTLTDPEIIKSGARAFSQRGCATCHGAPGLDWAKFSEGLRPYPPDLTEVAKIASAERIFWVIKNGVNMTAMPGFSLIGVDDKEVWSITAFVKQLPSATQDDYKAWTAAPPAAIVSP